MGQKAITGCLLGTATGDSMGLPYEGMSANRVAKFLKKPLRQKFLLGFGMVSDDTEHCCFVAKALVQANGDVYVFEKKLAWDLRWWFAGLPAGIGLATARAIIKLWLGFSPRNSGVFSAGNGPAMRSGLIGIFYADDMERLQQFVLHSTRLTHTDPKAYFGALTVALAARAASMEKSVDPEMFLNTVRKALENQISSEYEQCLEKIAASVARGDSLAQFADKKGCKQGITGYVYHTVPCVIQCWLRHQGDFAAGLEEIIAAGGDTDTTGAIYGAIAGAQVGKEGIPESWHKKIREYPCSTMYMEKLAEILNQAKELNVPQKPPRLFFPAILPRNLLFLAIVLLHGFRRLLPPFG